MSPVPVASPHPHPSPQILVTVLCCCLGPQRCRLTAIASSPPTPKAQLNPELMMMVGGRDPVPAGTTWREGRGRAEGRRRRAAEAAAAAVGCWEPPYTIAASRNSVWVVGAAERGAWAHRYFKTVFLLEKALPSTLSHGHTFTLTPLFTCTHLCVSPVRVLTRFSHHTYVHIQMSR